MGVFLMRSLILSLIATAGFLALGVPKVTINGATFPAMTFQNQTPPPGFENPVLAYVSWIHIPPPPSGFTNAGSFSPDGSPEGIAIPDAAGLEATSSLSVGCWVKGAAQSFKGILAKYTEITAGNRRPYFMFSSDSTNTDHFEVWVCSTGGVVCSTRKEYKALDAPAFDNTWHHIGFTFDAGTLLLYQDGAVTTSTKDRDDAMAAIDGTGTDAVYIGDMDSVSDFHFTGFIDECFVDTNTVYSGANYASIYNAGNPTSLTSFTPEGWWRFESDSDTNAGGIKDASGNNQHGSSNNLEAGDVNDADAP